jgi:DNA (cytosine-5)-methyltransferase 1
VLGSKILGWRTIGYVEFDTHCQRILRQRIEDGVFDIAPIFSDVRAFIGEGFADSYKGLVDVVSAGFPCTPFSVSGKNMGQADSRNMWPATIDVIRRVRPRFAFLENVPNILTHAYIGRIFGDLVESGFDCRWCVLSAANVGAPHRRDRLWIIARKVADTDCGRPQRSSAKSIPWFRDLSPQFEGSGSNVRDGWPPEPGVGRVVDGVANRAHRIKAIGNGQVPRVFATAWKLLMDEKNEQR